MEKVTLIKLVKPFRIRAGDIAAVPEVYGSYRLLNPGETIGLAPEVANRLIAEGIAEATAEQPWLSDQESNHG